jgi:hypothetical protein
MGPTEIKSRTEKALNVYVSGYLFAILGGVYVSSYFQKSLISVLSFNVDDGHCTAQTQGVGAHCFGDFYYPLLFINQDNPWSTSPIPYPPLGLIIFKPFAFLVETFPNSQFGLFAYLGFLILTVSTIPIHLFVTKKIDITNSIVAGMLILSSTPMIVALDRGNVIVICLPLLYFFLHYESQNNAKRSFILWITLVLIKPQFALLGLVFLRDANMRGALKRAVLGFAIFCLSFLTYPVGITENLRAYSKQLVGYQDYGSLGNVFPVNVSIGSALSLVDVFNKTTFTEATQIVSMILLLATVIVVYRSPAKLSMSVVLPVLMLPVILPQTSWHYYLTVLIPFFIFLITDKTVPKARIFDTKNRNFLHRLHNHLQIGLIVWALLIFAPWVIPWNVFAANQANFGALSTSMHWVLVIWSLSVCLVVSLIYAELSNRQNRQVRHHLGQ